MEAEVEVQITKATKSIDSLISSLKDLKKSLNDTLGSTENNKLDENTKKAKKNIDSIGAIKKALNFGGVIVGLRKGANLIKDISSEYINLTETNNLFEVSMGKVVDQYGNLDEEASQYYIKASKFQDEMNEKLLTNEAELKNYQAMYYSMLKSQGINKADSYFMSENLTKAGYDIASLYNLSIDEAMNKLKSGLAGQVESLRQIGIDVSESSLETVLNQLGIDRSVQELSYAEKEVARYIAIVQQGGQAQGDFARTMDNSANQIRIFKNQIAELKQVAGSFIVNTFGNILVYVNAIIMVIKEILKSFATLFGYDLESGGTNLVENTGIDDLNSGLGSAVGTAKELKKQLMGFDEINNITPQTNSGSGSGSGVSMGIDDKLLNALDEWDNKMDSISGKAQDIRDNMLEWLGFHRTDEGGWELNEGLTNFEKILDVAKAIGIAILSWKVSSAITNLLKNLGILKGTQAFKLAFGITLGLVGIYLLYKGIKHILEGNVDIFTILETALGAGATALSIVTILKGVAKGSGKTFNLKNSLKIGFGITLALAGVIMSFGATKKLLDGDASIATLLQSTGSALLVGLGVWIATGNPTAALLGGSATLALNLGLTIGIGLGNSIDGIVNGFEEVDVEASQLTDSINDLISSLDNTSAAYQNNIQSIKDTCEATQDEMDYAQALASQLDGLVDANGRVKAGNEERVDFILGELNNALDLELSRNGDLITKNGEVVNSYNDLKQSIDETIKKKKEEAEQEANLELYKESLKEEISLRKDLAKLESEQAKAQKEYDDLMSKGYSAWKLNHDENSKQIMENYADITEKTLEYRDKVKEASDDVSYYSDKMTQDTIKNTGILTDEMINQGNITSDTLQNMVKENYESWQQNFDNLEPLTQSAMLAQSTTLDTWSPQLQEKWAEMAQNSGENFMRGISQVEPSVASQILESISTVDNMSTEMVGAWSILAQKSYEEFNNAISQVDPSVQNEIIKTMTTTEGLTPTMQEVWKNMATNSKDQFNQILSTLPQETQTLIQTITSTTETFSPELIQQWADLAKNNKSAYENNLTGLDSTTSQRIQSCVDAINNKKWTAEETAKGLAIAVENGVNTIDTTEAGRQAVNGVTKGINDNKNNKSLWSAIGGLVTNVKNWFKNLFGIHSPSKVMADLAQYIPLGIAEGIKENTSTAVNQAKTMAEDVSNAVTNNIDTDTFGTLKNGIEVNTKDFAVDTNEYVDYSAIRGQVEARSNMTIDSNIIQGIAQAVRQALNETQVNVNIEAKADEGVIVKKASEGFTNYVMQTGELPFPIPV